MDPGSAFGGTLQLWCAYPDDLLDEKTAAACTPLLNEEERERWQRFRLERSRREFLATHALVRTVLSRYRAVAPQDWRFTANKYGKPALMPDCGLHFNLSNSAGMAICLVADAPTDVGVDVEPHLRAQNIAEVARRVLSQAEHAQLQALPGAAKLERCLSLWTLKEAYIKARGMGMALPLEEISFLFDDAGRVRLELEDGMKDDAARWWFRLFNHAGHRIAVMAEAKMDWALQAWEFHRLDFPPRRILLQSGMR